MSKFLCDTNLKSKKQRPNNQKSGLFSIERQPSAFATLNNLGDLRRAPLAFNNADFVRVATRVQTRHRRQSLLVAR